jgi:hypothetical protein
MRLSSWTRPRRDRREQSCNVYKFASHAPPPPPNYSSQNILEFSLGEGFSQIKVILQLLYKKVAETTFLGGVFVSFALLGVYIQ